MNKNSVSPEKLRGFLDRNGKAGARVLSILGKTQSFCNAIQTPIGQEILGEVVNRLEHLLEKIIAEKSTPEDRAEYRVLKSLSMKWAEKINKHQIALEKLQNN